MDTNIDFPINSDSPWGSRVPLIIDSVGGTMTAGVSTRPINIYGDIDYALSSFLSMVYELRNLASGVIPLRQEDIQSLASAFQMEEMGVTQRLARLMHCDDLQTKRLVQMVKKGRVLVPVSMVAAGAILAASLTFSSPTTSPTQTNVKPHVTAVSSNTVSADLESTSVSDGSEVSDEVAKTNVENKTQTTFQVNSSGEVQDKTSLPAAGEVQIGEGIRVTREDTGN